MHARQSIGYCPESGHFYFNGRIVDAQATKRGRPGYRFVHWRGHKYRAHRLAWLFMTGEFPALQIDHINRDKGDNRWANLRLATPSQNRANEGLRVNNASGARNVRFYARYEKWHAQVQACGRKYHLGYFANKEAAAHACETKRRELFGDYA